MRMINKHFCAIQKSLNLVFENEVHKEKDGNGYVRFSQYCYMRG
jgi:hypothetical protein